MNRSRHPRPTRRSGVNQFTIAGRVTGWAPHTRQVTVGLHTLWVATTVSVVGLAVGNLIVASGYQQDPGAQWIVTQFTLD